MSVINKMLKDLDERQSGPRGDSGSGSAVRMSSERGAPGHEWLWRVLAILMLVALLWACWVAYQIWPRPIATELALREGFKPAASVAAAHAPSPPSPADAVSARATHPQRSEGLDRLRLATEITTPIRSATTRLPPAVQATTAVPGATDAQGAPAQRVPAMEPTKPEAQRIFGAVPPAIQHHAADLPAKGAVDKRDRMRTLGDRAEVSFRQAVAMLNQGRVSEAEELLVSALNLDPAHAAARQTHVAMLLEQGRVDAARRELQVALALDPGQGRFALPLARIQAERREYAAALEVLGKVPEHASGPDLNALHAVVLQRMGRHAEAIVYHERSLRASASDAPTLLGYGISLEALRRFADAAQAYRRVLAIKTALPEIRAYAEGRLRALE
jgi:MSHA biogenesis protein MshN